MSDEPTTPQTETTPEEVQAETPSAEATPVIPEEPVVETETPLAEEKVPEPTPAPVVEAEPEPITPEVVPKIYDLNENPETPEETQPAEKPVEETTESAEQTESGEDKPFTARTEETGDKVYIIVKGKRYWAKNPETLRELGFTLGQEKKVPFSELLKWSEGDPADMTVPNAVKPWEKPVDEKAEAEKKDNLSVWS